MAFKVKEVASLAGISVRTLHHYDRIGLLVPDDVSESGYRLYSDANLERLQQILFFKEIGLPLEEIKEILDRPDFNRKEALSQHRELLLEKKLRLERMIATVDRTLNSIEGGLRMEKDQLFEGFSMKDVEEHQKKYATEARELYGKEIVEKTEKRTSGYSKSDWEDLMGDMNDIYRKIAERMEFGAGDPEVQDLVGKWREHISKNFYECTLETFRGLGDLYVADERFTKNIDRFGAGLAAFLRDAMHIYCDREEREKHE